MRDIASRRRFGYRRVGVMLERKGHVMNHKKHYRLYREEGLSVRRRRGRKRARRSRTLMPIPLRPNDRWSMNFVAEPQASEATRSALPAGCAFWRSTMSCSTAWLTPGAS